MTDDNAVIVSFRGCSQILKIRRNTGEIVWRFGGADSDFTITDDPVGEFCGQHTVIVIQNGNLLLFDNESYCLGPRETDFGQFTLIVEYELDLEAGEARFVRDLSLGGAFENFTDGQGSAQLLSNGHMVAGWARGTDTSVTEFDEKGNEVFAMSIFNSETLANSYRALRHPS